jgi:prefoldin subunit 5
MSTIHPNDVILQRNRYREELASVRLKQDSLHAAVTSLRNTNDRLESENVDLQTQIKVLQKQIARMGSQQRGVRSRVYSS